MYIGLLLSFVLVEFGCVSASVLALCISIHDLNS